MKTVCIIKKEVKENGKWLLLTVEVTSNKKIIEVVDPKAEVKKGKDGKPKKSGKVKKDKFPTTILYFKFETGTTVAEIKADIKKRIQGIAAAESDDIPLNTPLDLK